MDTPCYTVCLIDDDRIYQFAAKKVLEATKLTRQILSFTNGQEALAFIKSNSTNETQLPDVIFLDINMPILDGWQFLHQLKPLLVNLPKQFRIIMVSSSVDDYDIKKAKEFDWVSGYVVKPINKEKFQQLLTNNTGI